jgi:hypothetical protein
MQSVEPHKSELDRLAQEASQTRRGAGGFAVEVSVKMTKCGKTITCNWKTTVLIKIK